MTEGEIWDPASVTYADWSGTAQLDQEMTSANLSEVVGLDAAVWLPVGVEVSGGPNGYALRVLAVHRSQVAPTGSDVFDKIAAANGGELPVTEFLVRDVDPLTVLRAVAHQFALRMRSRGTRDLPIRVTSRAALPQPKRPLT